MLSATFQTRESARALADDLRVAVVPSEVKRGRHHTFEVWIDVGDRDQAGPIVDRFRATHGDPAPNARRRHDWLILGGFIGATLGMIATLELNALTVFVGVVSMAMVGGVLGFCVDHLSYAARRQGVRRFGMMELFVLTALVAILLTLSKQIPLWLRMYE